ncbi:MAG TPA: SDR family oxidoreductase [Acidimicrobiia bacterium]|nr:SDR family oxidoreductase [Acidimicrobiia bacterium]
MTTSVVTGASAGIGAAFARALAARGDDLVLVARSRARLDDLAAALIRDHGVGVEVLPADLTDAADLARVEARVGDRARPVDLLVNNAGFGTAGSFDALPVEREDEEVRLNVLAVVRLTHAALDGMTTRGDGAIVNVSSVAGYQPNPGMATYGATKAFVSSFTQAVHEEVRSRGVHVMLVCPGFTRTDFQERAGVDQSDVPGFAWMEPDRVVADALRALDARRAVCVPGALNRVAAVMSDVAPAGVTRRVAGLVLRRSARH